MVDVSLVVGAEEQLESHRLEENWWEFGNPSQVSEDGRELEPEQVVGVHTVGIMAGAPAPEVLVEDVIDALRRLYPIEFRLPPDLAAA